MGPYRSLFVLMVSNVSLWVLIGTYASLWVLMGFYRSLSALTNSIGSSWILISANASL